MKTEYLLLLGLAAYFLLVKKQPEATRPVVTPIPPANVPSTNPNSQVAKNPVQTVIDVATGIFNDTVGKVNGLNLGNPPNKYYSTGLSTSFGDPGESVAANPSSFNAGVSPISAGSLPVSPVNVPASTPRYALASARATVARNVVPYSPFSTTANRVLSVMNS